MSIARYFNGVSDYIDFGTGVPDLSGGYSVSFWINPTSYPSGAVAFLWGLYSGGSNFLVVYLTSGGVVQSLVPQYAYTGAIVLSLGVWCRVTTTYSYPGSLAVYINGVEDGSVVTGPTHGGPVGSTAGLDANAGANVTTGIAYFNGGLADIAVWNTALTQAQVNLLSTGSRANTIGQSATNFVGYWPVTGASPEPDQSGYGDIGVLNGTSVGAGPPPLVAQGAPYFPAPVMRMVLT